MAAGLRLVPIACAVLLAGCTEPSIYRTDYLDSGKSVVTDAKQRIVTNTKGNVSWGRNRPRRIVCAEPSPDVAQALSSAISASFAGAAQGRGNVSADVSASMSAGIVQLGERLATVQLLRDGLYRACEAYSNGAISDATYSLIVSRVDQTMVALLGSEMAAGAFGRDLAAIGGSAGGTTGLGEADKTRLEALEKRKSELNGKIATELSNENSAAQDIASKRSDLAVETDPDRRTAIQTEIDQQRENQIAARSARKGAEAELATVDGQIAQLNSASSFASTSARGGGGIFGGVGEGNAKYVAEIQETFTNQDKLGPLVAACVTALDSSSTYKAHVHRSQDLDPERDAEGNPHQDGPRSTPLSDLCYRMMNPDDKGRSQLLAMFDARNEHSENIAIIKSTKEIFEVYYRQCATKEAEASPACQNMSRALTTMVLRRRPNG